MDTQTVFYKTVQQNAFAGVLLLMFSVTANAHASKTDSGAGTVCSKEQAAVHCGVTPSGVFDKQGRFWVVFVKGEHVYLSYSDDNGQHYSPAIRINAKPETVYADGENRPKLALGLDGEIYVSWTQKTNGRYTGDIRFSRSLDKGKTFDAVKTVNDDNLLTSHRFDSMLVDRKGHIYLAWLDKRDQEAAKIKGKSYHGSAVYYTVSTDQGQRFSANRKVADHACECCRMSIAAGNKEGAAIFWRHIFANNIRDHAFAVLGEKEAVSGMQRATHDGWQIEACPHHGPAIASDNKYYDMTWFTNAPEKKGIYYGYYNPDAKKMENEIQVSRLASASHPFILRRDSAMLYLVWKEFDGEKTVIQLTGSANAGKTWEDQRIIAESNGASDHPFLLKGKEKVYLSWHTQNEGMRLLPVEIDTKVAKK